MVELRRTVRFAINPPSPGGTAGPADEGTVGKNGFGGFPRMRGLGRHYEIEAVCRGEPDPATGYLINIKRIDEAVRSGGVPAIASACADAPWRSPESLLPEVAARVGERLGGLLHALTWRLTPTYSVSMAAGETTRCELRQQFDLAAAHRLHTPGLSDEENREVFGRCNNPSGHGHNYRIEPVVAAPIPDADAPPAFSLADLERVTAAAIVDPFDHTHFNEDREEFGAGTGVNPTVENIAKVFYERLAAAIAREAGPGVELRSITVWETDRTSCTYPMDHR